MKPTAIRQFPGDTFSVLNADGDAHLVAFDEHAVYGVELAFPESDDDAYRVDAVRLTRDPHGAELTQRLTLDTFASHMEAEERLAEVSTDVFEHGREALPLETIAAQPPDYTAGYLVASHPPDALFTGASASVSVIGITPRGIHDALVAWNLPPHEAAHLSMYLEDSQMEGGAPLLLAAAQEEAQAQGMLAVNETLFATPETSPLAYLDQREELSHAAQIVQPDRWGWQDTRFVALSDHQVALLDVYRDALSSDLAGEILPISQHGNALDAEAARDALIEAAWDSDPRQLAEAAVDDPQWQSMQTEHYALYERLAGLASEPDVPPDEFNEPLLAEATRLGAALTIDKQEETAMSNSLQAERHSWHIDLKEHVTPLPPYVTAEYRVPDGTEGITPVRLRPEGDASMYGFEVSAPDDNGAVSLAATKTFESDILQKPVTEYATLKTYHPSDYDESASYLNPRSDALSDARALVYEWGRKDLDHAMGSALLLAQDNGIDSAALFEQGPADTFAPVEDARPVAAIQTEREWERDAEIFGKDGYRIPQPEGMIHAREVGRFGVDTEIEAGQFYGVTVREAHLGEEPDAQYPPVYVVEGVKAWLDKDTNAVESETVTLDVRGSQETGMRVADMLADEPELSVRMQRMAAHAHKIAEQLDETAVPMLGANPIEHLNLNLRVEGLFEQGPPDPKLPSLDNWQPPDIDPPGRLATPIGAYVDRHASDYVETAGAIVTGYDGERYRTVGTAQLALEITDQAPPDEIEYRVLPLDTLTIDPTEPHAPAEYDPVRMKPIEDEIPADHDAEYAFGVRHIRAFDMQGELTDSYHVVEAVKSWHDPNILWDEDERLTLALPLAAYDDKEPAFETAHQLTAKWWAEGVQPAMQDAANMAAGHLRPDIMDVENGHLFGMGPADPFTVEFPELARETTETPAHDTRPAEPESTDDYTRIIGEAAYDLPLEDGQGYAFRARHLPVLEERLDATGMNVMAIEAVKFWDADGERQEAATTLSIYHQFDDRAAETEVDTYVDLAEREGIQAAMTRAAFLADVQHIPAYVREADTIDIHLNPDVRYGDMFEQGPDDPFLSEREINHIAVQYEQANPPQHRLSLEVVPVQDQAGKSLGHSVVALDATWDADEQPDSLEDALSVTAYELAQFETQAGADFYAMGLSEYMAKQSIDPQGTDINPALNFIKGVQSSNGFAEQEHWLTPHDVSQLSHKAWTLQHAADDFQPLPVEAFGSPTTAEITAPDLEL